MALGHTKPPESLLRELKDVAHAAHALVDVMDRGLNFPLPTDFPADQLADICRSLMQLPEGTAEGARSPLDYANSRLPAIRRQYVPAEGCIKGDAEPSLTRGAVLDQKLTALMIAVSTAFDEYRNLASEQPEDFKTEAGIVPNKGSVAEATKQAVRLDESLATAGRTLDEIAEPSSRRADDLKRQLKDARGLNQLASAEVRMPRVVPGWLRKTLDALKKSPEIIAKTVDAINVGVDVSEVFVDRWHSFSHDSTKFIFTQIRKTLKATRQAAELVKEAQNGHSSDEDDEQDDEPKRIERALSRRSEIQRQVRSRLDELDAIDTRYREVRPDSRDIVENNLLADLQELTRLETFIKMHRQLSLDDAAQPSYSAEPSLGRAGHGMTQRAFTRLAIIAMRRAGRPLESGEIVEEFKKIGHPIGGTHEIKTAYNRLSKAKQDGVLTHVMGAGYWVAGLDLPETALDAVASARAARKGYKRSGSASERSRPGNRHGRRDTLGAEEQAAAIRAVKSGRSFADVGRQYGVSAATIARYCRLESSREGTGAVLPRRKVRQRKPLRPRVITGKLGRRPKLSEEQVLSVVAMREAGRPVEAIAEEFDVSIDVIYRHLRGRSKG